MSTQLSRLAREQLRANEIGERALREARESAALARTALDRPSPAAREVRLPTGRPALPISTPAEPAGEPEQKALRVLESLMPVLDAIEAGLESGRGQLEHLDDAQARTLLAAWLDGQRLLRERLLSLFEREGIRLHPGISIGVAAFPQDATDAASLFQRADEALYRAKLGGKNRVSR